MLHLLGYAKPNRPFGLLECAFHPLCCWEAPGKGKGLAAEWLPEEWLDGIPSLKQLLDGSASVTLRIPTLKERLYGSFTTDSSGIDGLAFGRIEKSEVTVGKRIIKGRPLEVDFDRSHQRLQQGAPS